MTGGYSRKKTPKCSYTYMSIHVPILFTNARLEIKNLVYFLI